MPIYRDFSVRSIAQSPKCIGEISALSGVLKITILHTPHSPQPTVAETGCGMARGILLAGDRGVQGRSEGLEGGRGERGERGGHWKRSEMSYTLILNTIDGTHTGSTENVLPIAGVIFDMDGTLTKPQTWMFGEMRRQLQVPDGIDILHHLNSLPTQGDRDLAEQKLKQIEEKAMNEQEPTVGLTNIFKELQSLNVNTSICTRNVPKPVSSFCKKFLNFDPYDDYCDEDNNNNNLISGPIITREFKPPKPSPEPLLHIISNWNVDPKQVIMVGDSFDDIEAGLNAGCAVVLLKHKDNSHVEDKFVAEENLDASVTDLNELLQLLKNGLHVKQKNLN